MNLRCRLMDTCPDEGQRSDMSEPAGKPRLSEIYREQYREVSASKTSRAFRWITPVGLLVVAALGVILGRGAHDILSIILGGGD